MDALKEPDWNTFQTGKGENVQTESILTVLFPIRSLWSRHLDLFYIKSKGVPGIHPLSVLSWAFFRIIYHVLMSTRVVTRHHSLVPYLKG